MEREKRSRGHCRVKSLQEASSSFPQLLNSLQPATTPRPFPLPSSWASCKNEESLQYACLLWKEKRRRRDSSQISLSVSGLAMASATSRVTACLSAPPNLIDASHARYVVLPRSAVHHTHSTTCIGATPYNLVKHLEGWIHGKWVPFTEFDAE